MDKLPTTAKGMRDLLGEEFYAYQGFFEKAAEIAIYYGFTPVETPILEQETLFTSGLGEGTDVVAKEMYTLRTRGGDKLALRPEGTAAVLRAYFENGLPNAPQPALLYYYGPFFRHDRPQKGRYRELRQFGLETIGTSKSVADALTIKLVLLILEESGLKNLRLEINTIGDKDCRPTWRRELVTYYKRHLKDVCPDCRERFKDNPLRLLDCKNPRCRELAADAPSALEHLCEPCQAHFKEVLEYLEMMGISYEINNALVRGLDYYSRTVFEISEPAAPNLAGSTTPEEGPPLTLAAGGRYDYLARTLGAKKPVAAVGAAIGVDRVLQSPNYEKFTPRFLKTPKIFFIQLGFEAKLKSVSVIEILRRAKWPIAQTLAKDSLGSQLAQAEKMGVPYAVILGQKEVLENTVIVRHMDNRSQEVVPIPQLADYLKKLK